MATCSDATCNCRILAGAGVILTGSGSLSNPFVISTDTQGLVNVFRVNDTPTVNLTLYGTGTVDDPLVLSADSTLRMTQLADVADPEGGPAPGESPIWVGTGSAGHFEFQPPVPSPPGSVNVGAGLGGTGAVATPLYVRMIGTSSGGATTGLEVYADSAGNLRAVPPTATAVDWATITGKPSSFPPSTHSHPVTQITDPQNFVGARSVGNSLKTNNIKISSSITAGATPPASGNTAGDLFFRKA